MTVRVLHVLSSLDSKAGGPIASILGLAPALATLGLDVSVLSTNHIRHDGHGNAQRLTEQGVNVRLFGPTRGKRSRHPTIPDECSRAVANADIVHIHGIWEMIQKEAARVARTTNKPYIFRPCGMLDPWSLARRRWLKELVLMAGLRKEIKGATALHYVSKTEARGSASQFPNVKSIVEPNGVDVDFFSGATPSGLLRARLGIDANTPLILFLGRVHYKKGIDILIRAAGQLAREQMAFRLIIAGPAMPKILEELVKMTNDEAIADRVSFTGMMRRQETLEALGDADLFVLPSRHENFGVSVAEAMAAGVPVIVSDQVALCHEVLECGAGRVVAPEPSQLADTMKNLLHCAEERQQLGAAGRAFAGSHFSWHSIAERWQEHYRELAKRE